MVIDKAVINPEVHEFIKTHENANLVKLILKGSPFESVDIQSIAQQIKGRQVAKKKLPNLYACDSIIYPPKLNLEQASSQVTAAYKAQFIKTNQTVLDLTGGIGIDTLAFAKQSQKVFYCEINPETFAYANHNFKALHKNITTHCGDGLGYFKKHKHRFDWVYLDPARRDKHTKKVIRLENSTPNVLEHLELLKSKAKGVIIKTSPLLDINLCIKQIHHITHVHIVAVKNEVKELLLIVDFEKSEAKTKMIAVNLETCQKKFSSTFDKKGIKQEFSKPQTYLYEPNAAIMKSGFYGEICQKYGLKALAEHTHLMTSDVLKDFPGRRFKIKKVLTPQKKLLKKHLPDLKANVSCRNYPLKPNQIKAKYGMKDGGEDYLFFATNHKNQKIVLFCNKIRL